MKTKKTKPSVTERYAETTMRVRRDVYQILVNLSPFLPAGKTLAILVDLIANNDPLITRLVGEAITNRVNIITQEEGFNGISHREIEPRQGQGQGRKQKTISLEARLAKYDLSRLDLNMISDDEDRKVVLDHLEKYGEVPYAYSKECAIKHATENGWLNELGPEYFT